MSPSGFISFIITILPLLVIFIIITVFNKIKYNKQFNNTKASGVANSYQQRMYNNAEKIRRNNMSSSFGMGKEKDIFVTSEGRKAIRRNNECKEIDCDLDERVFGPKNQHKDIF